MINVSGPDIQNQIVYIWELGDSYQGGAVIPTPPAEHTLTVPRGSNRLIQVLAIVAEIDASSQGGGDDGSSIFFYGETIKSLANAVEPVTIALVQESTTSAGDGSISGRYFFADGSTPTGPVDMYYAPVGRRPMIVESTSIFSGHFHFFLLPTVPFTFRMRSTGVPLFENVTTNSFSSRYSDRLLQIAIPAGYRDYGSGAREFRAAQIKILGFAGPGATLVGRAICYPTPTSPLPDFYDAATGGNEIQWSPGSTSATDVRILGGIGTADGQCPAYTNEGLNSFGIYLDDLMDGDSPLGNRGPFKLLDLGGGQGSTYLDVAVDNGNLAIKWDYLAEVVGNSVDGVGIFYKVFPSSEGMDDRWHDNAPCNQLSSFGFTEITRVPAGSAGDPVISYNWTNLTTPNLTAFNSGRLKTVVCPYTNSRPGYYDFAVSHYQHSGGGIGGAPTATKLSVTAVTEPTVVSSAAGRQYVSESTCTVLKIATTDSAGNVLRRANTSGTAQVSVQVMGAPAGVRLFSNLNCSSPAGGASSLSQFLINNAAAIGVLADSTVGDFELVVTDITPGGSPLPTLTHFVTKIAPQNASHIVTFANPNIVSWQCYAIGFVRGRMGATVFIGESGDTGNLNLAPVTDVTYYIDDQCSSTTTPGVSFAANQSFSMRFFKYIGSSSSINLAPDTTGFPGLVNSGGAINVSPPAAPTRLRYEISNSLSVNACHGFRIVAVNGKNEYSPIGPGSSRVVNYSFIATPGSIGGIYMDSSCTIPAGGTVSIAPGTTKSDTYFFRWSTPNTQVTLGGTSTLPVSSVTLNIFQ